MPASIIDSPLTRSRKSPFVERGERDVLLDVLLGEQRAAGGDLAERAAGARRRRSTAAAGSGSRALAADQLERARLGRVAAEQAGALEVRQVRVDGRGRGEADPLADLAHRRRVAVAVDVLDEVVPDLLLAGGEHRRLRHGVAGDG